MKLKTLKDLKHFNQEDLSGEEFYGIALQSRWKKGREKGFPVRLDMSPTFVHALGLKLEAIKWAKKIQIRSLSRKENWQRIGALSIMMEFFNITEEDLK